MQIANIHEAKSHLSKLIDLAFQGEDVVICKAGKPLVRLIKYQKTSQPRIPGAWKGKVTISKDFDELPDSFMAAFRGDKD